MLILSSTFGTKTRKLIFYTKNAQVAPQKGNIFVFKGPRKVLMALFCSHQKVDQDDMGIKHFPALGLDTGGLQKSRASYHANL